MFKKFYLSYYEKCPSEHNAICPSEHNTQKVSFWTCCHVSFQTWAMCPTKHEAMESRNKGSPLQLKSVHFKKQVTRSSFLSKSVVIFNITTTNMTTLFERNEDRVTGFLKWTDFRIDTADIECTIFILINIFIRRWEVILTC